MAGEGLAGSGGRSGFAITSQIRGVIGRARASEYGVTEREKAAAFRTGLQYAILKSRTREIALNPEGFFKAVHDATAVERARFSRFPTGDDYLRVLVDANVVPFGDELVWLATRLSYEAAALAVHVRMRVELDACLLRQDWPAAITILDEHDSRFGHSLWSIALRLAVVQAHEGKDAQKQIVKVIRSTGSKVVLPFFATYVSQRAEATTSIGWFIDDMSRRLGRLPSGSTRTYLKYKLLAELPNDPADVASILRVEQSHNLIDQYETMLDLVHNASVGATQPKHRDAIVRSLSLLKDIADARIQKPLLWLTGGNENVQENAAPLDTDLFHQVLVGATGDRARPMGIFSDMSAHRLFTLAVAYAGRSKHSAEARVGKTLPTHLSNIMRGLSYGVLRQTCRSAPDRVSSVDYARKYGHVFSGTPTGIVIRHLLDGFYNPDLVTAKAKLCMAAFGVPSDGVLDLMAQPSARAYQAIRGRVTTDAVGAFFGSFYGLGEDLAALRPSARWYADIARAFAEKDLDRALRIWDAGKEGHVACVVNQTALLVLTILAGQGEVIPAARLLASQAITMQVEPTALPVSAVFDGVVWRDLKDGSHLIELSNAMSLIASKGSDDRTRSYRRFALERFLLTKNLDRPSLLQQMQGEIEADQLVYFLSRVCTPPMLDMLPELERTSQVLQERRDICGYLVGLDREGSEAWESEVLTISRELAIQEGLQTFDGSRVHVDMDALISVVKKEISESFQRYEFLDRANAPSSEHFEAAIKEMFKRESQVKSMLNLGVREADELMISIAYRSLQQFLFNVPHGLDSYLSKRVRHGSIVGFIRSPAERDGVIAQRLDDGSYLRSGTWADNVSDNAQRSLLIDAILTFSRSIDEHLIRLRDVLLHVRSDEKPYGMVDVRLTGKEYATIASVAETGVSIDLFTRFVLAFHRRQLRPSLLAIGLMLGSDLLRFVSDQFQILRDRARNVLLGHADRVAFDAAAGAASAAVQSAVTAASLWFDPADLTPREYSLAEVINIADASVRAVTKAYAPRVNIRGDGSTKVNEHTFAYLIDVLYVAFGNIAEHANVGPNPSVEVTVTFDDFGKTIALEIVNEFSPRAPLHVVQAELEDRARDISDGEHAEKARQDKDSGLHKIASIVMHDGKGQVSFGATEASFRLSVTVPMFEHRDLDGDLE